MRLFNKFNRQMQEQFTWRTSSGKQKVMINKTNINF